MMRALLRSLVPLIAGLGMVFAGPAAAQSSTLIRPHAELPSAEQPRRVVPITSYTLALSWTPEYCHSHDDDRSGECASPAAGGFTLHGLWPDGAGEGQWPQYCRSVGILSDAQLRAGIGVTPSTQLLQHEWAKHGSCMGGDPSAYFTEETRLFRSIHIPDMAALSARRDLAARDVAEAFAAANPGMTADMVRLNVNKRGWLEEVWLCLDRDRRIARCGAGQGGGAAADTSVRIETGAVQRYRANYGRRPYRRYQ